VVIPLYNKAAYVGQAVRSALAQRCAPMEIIVVDDGSTDDGAAVVSSMGLNRLRLIVTANAGVSAARNTGIRAAQGDYIALLDADDWWAPDYICAIRALIDRYPGCAMYGTAYRVVTAENELPPEVCESELEASMQLIRNYFGERNKRPLFSTSSLCVPRAAFSENNIWFPPGESHGEDHDVWFRLAERGATAFVNIPLSAYRRSDPTSLTQLFEWRQFEPAYQRLFERTTRQDYPPELKRAARHLVHRRGTSFARNNLVRGRRKEAITQLLRVCRPATSAYWWSTLLGCILPNSLRRRVLTTETGWKDHLLYRRIVRQPRDSTSHARAGR
jgi:hypothetical protein